MHLSDRSTEQVAPVRFCMCNLHSLVSNENFTLKVGNIQIRQLLRLYPDSWLEAGSIHVPELRINAKLDCHTSKPTHLNEQMQYLRRHDQALPRLHFLYQTRSHQSIAHPSSGNTRFACACLGGSPVYFTLVTGEEFFRTSFRLGEQSSFGRSLFRPDLHVVHSSSSVPTEVQLAYVPNHGYNRRATAGRRDLLPVRLLRARQTAIREGFPPND